MLSFEDYGNGKAIALILGRKKNNILYLYNDAKDVKFNKNMIEDEYYSIVTKDFKGKKKMKTNEIEMIKKYLIENRDIIDEEHKEYFDKTKKRIINKLTTSVELNAGEIMQPLPQKVAECIMICGPSGSGKSTYAANYYNYYKKMDFVENPRLFVFSRLTEDEAIDELKPYRIKIDQQLIENPIEPVELKNSCVLFDDIETIGSDTNKEGRLLRDSVIDLRDKLLEARRHDNITMLCTSHHIFNYKNTRTLLLESDAITFFPKSSGEYHIKRLLKEQIGLTKENINKILKLPSR